MTILDLVVTRPLERITLKEVLEESHVSKSTFYTFYTDLNDLISGTFQYRIVETSWDMMTSSYDDYHLAILLSLKKMLKHQKFCRELYAMEGQNKPLDSIIRTSMQLEIKDLGSIFTLVRDRHKPELIASFHSYGVINSMFQWILLPEDKRLPADEFARAITDARFALIACFLKNDKIIAQLKKSGNAEFYRLE